MLQSVHDIIQKASTVDAFCPLERDKEELGLQHQHANHSVS